MLDSDDEEPVLADDLLAAIAQAQAVKDADPFPEDWQLSQFWYDDETSVALAKEAVTGARGGRAVFVSAPTAFRAAIEHFPQANVTLLEHDRRFEAFGDRFVFYDFNSPTDLPQGLRNSFDFVLADPPFLSEDCLKFTMETLRFLRKSESTPMMICTGLVQEEHVMKHMGGYVSKFRPQHHNKLGNPFACFTTYRSEALGVRDE
mmetsp:Transcript_16311/g.35388  ORF Transcript_16311/g.35388 Transcript_16311/m.35388 type:complete len:204 (+) Transcript_16311:3-614(+)